MMFVLDSYKRWIERNEGSINSYANHLIVIFAFSMPILVSVRRVSVALLILLFFLRGNIWYHTKKTLSDPLLLSFFLYFAVHVIWLIGSDNAVMAKKSLHDSAFLLFLPLFVTFIDRRFIGRITSAFVLGMLVSVMVSFGIFFEVIPGVSHNINQGGPGNPTPLYHHTHYGYMLAITCIMLLNALFNNKDSKYKVLAFSALFSVTVLNMFIIEGRSGYILFVILLLPFLLFRFKTKAARPLLIALFLCSATMYVAYHTVDVFKDRVDLTVQSTEKILNDKNYNTSIGGRVGMLTYSMGVISDKFLFGYGTGDHASVVVEVVKAENRALSNLVAKLQHPHNEFINALIQFGVVGLLAFLNILYQMMRYSSDNNGIMLKVIAISIFFYSLIDVFVIGLGMLLTVLVLTSVYVNSYYIENASYRKIDARQILMYSGVMLFFYGVKIVSP